MNYWMTVHWPPHEGLPIDDVAAGVWVPEGRQTAALDFAEGDLVLIYHPRTGRTAVEEKPDGSVVYHPCQRGREGVVGVGRALVPITARSNIEPEKYTDGTEIWWRWHAELELLVTSGFVPREYVCKALGFKESYNFRGFGDAHSGLKKIDASVFDEILGLLRKAGSKQLPIIQPVGGCPHGGGVESDAHRALKNYVAEHCADVFGEGGLVHMHTEYSFTTGDRADIVLEDRFGRIMGVEVEVDVGPHDLTGTLQAVKYRWMLEVVRGSKHRRSRAALVAYSIDESVRQISREYGVECIEVLRSTIENSVSGMSPG